MKQSRRYAVAAVLLLAALFHGTSGAQSVFNGFYIVDSAGNAVTVTGGGLTISHITGSLHVGGTIPGARFHVQGLGIPGQAHGGVLTVQGIAGGVAQPISGTVAATQSGAWNVSAAQSGANPWNVTAHQGGNWNVAHMGVVHVMAVEAPWHTKSSFQRIAASDANYRLLHSNSARVSFMVYNHAANAATATLYLLLGQHATTESFTVIIPQGGLYECAKPCYTGDVDAVWRDSVQGSAKVTEITR